MAAHSKNFVILACTVSIGLQSVTDGRTDTQTSRPWIRRAKHSAIARKNWLAVAKNGAARLNGLIDRNKFGITLKGPWSPKLTYTFYPFS